MFVQTVNRIRNLIAFDTPLVEIHDKVIEDLDGDEGSFFLHYKAAQQLVEEDQAYLDQLEKFSDEWDFGVAELVEFLT